MKKENYIHFRNKWYDTASLDAIIKHITRGVTNDTSDTNDTNDTSDTNDTIQSNSIAGINDLNYYIGNR